jgi:pyrroline-5-carboxylate reductase
MSELNKVELISLGAGRMASAIIGGLLQNKRYQPAQIACTCGEDPSGPDLAQRTGIIFARDIGPHIPTASTILLACKPQQLDSLPKSYAELTADKLVVSILAGVTSKRLRAVFPAARNIVRTMPNTPGQIGAGVTAYAPMETLATADRAILDAILGALGQFVEVAEADLDAVTALSGSGPAYVFAFVEAMRDAGIGMGLSAGTASMLAVETLAGSSLLLKSSDQTPQALREAVTSPGGTTAAALRVFGEQDFAGLVARAMEAARARSMELGKEK